MYKYYLLLVLCCLGFSLYAQQTAEEAASEDLNYYSSSPKESSRPERFIDNLWFGGGMQLGFQSNNSVSIFSVGVSPMAGYKVTNSLSFGPRVSINYNSFRCPANNVKSNYMTWEAGLFGRMKVFNQFFAHAEYTLENRRLIIQCAEPTKQIRSMPYLGIGYTSGGPGFAGSEALLLFRLNRDGQSIVEAPFVIRAGFNYNF